MQLRKAVIAEDEPLLRAELVESLAQLWPELRVCAEAEDGVDALRAIEQHAPDILFLDIQMPGLSGLDVARHVGSKCHIVFVTAYDKYAVAAFEQGAVDYVMKPFWRRGSRRRSRDSRRKPAPSPPIWKECCSRCSPRAPASRTCAGSLRPKVRTCGSSLSRKSRISRRTTSTRSSSRRIRSR